jgi:parvulin-like peptidyl-prolyl isomerase
MKRLLFFLLMLSQTSFGQGLDRQLKNVTTEEEAQAFIQAHPELQGEVLTLYAASDTAARYQPLFRKRKGQTLTAEGYTYKILSDTTAYFSRVSYIYLDGSQLTTAQIDSLRKVILKKLEESVPFSELARLYTMDGNPNGGDTGWFTEGTMVAEFEKALKKHRAPEVFTIDLRRDKWYYVVKKTHDAAVSKRLAVLKIKATPQP